jgi:hypothetical protein
MSHWGPQRLAALVILLVISGCGPSLRHNDRVEGTVTLDGKKVPGATVELTPLVLVPSQPHSRSRGVTDQNGHFSLRTTVGNLPGATVCKHRVTIQAPQGTVPAAYEAEGQTPLFIEITADQHEYELKLTKDARPSGARNVGD